MFMHKYADYAVKAVCVGNDRALQLIMLHIMQMMYPPYYIFHPRIVYWYTSYCEFSLIRFCQGCKNVLCRQARQEITRHRRAEPIHISPMSLTLSTSCRTLVHPCSKSALRMVRCS